MRKMTWLVLGWTVACAVWLIVGQVQSSGTAATDAATASCVDPVYGSYTDTCATAYNAGRGIAAMLIVGVWFLVFLVLMIVWFATRPKAGPVVQQVLMVQREDGSIVPVTHMQATAQAQAGQPPAESVRPSA